MDPSFHRHYFASIILALLFFVPPLFAQSAPTFSQVIVFGDSLSDDGNIRNRLEDQYLISYPGGDFNYSDGRFTNSHRRNHLTCPRDLTSARTRTF